MEVSARNTHFDHVIYLIILHCVAEGAACTNLRHAQVMYKLLTGRFPSRVAPADLLGHFGIFCPSHVSWHLGDVQEDMFDDKPGENWVGSPAMKRRGI